MMYQQCCSVASAWAPVRTPSPGTICKHLLINLARGRWSSGGLHLKKSQRTFVSPNRSSRNNIFLSSIEAPDFVSRSGKREETRGRRRGIDLYDTAHLSPPPCP